MSRGWSVYRAELEARGFRPSKRLGQNFLRDPNLARAIARDSGVGAGDFVLEVGPGPGMLTAALVERGARVLAVEIDERLIAVARAVADRTGAEAPPPDDGAGVGALRGEVEGGQVEFLHADALAGKHALSPALLERLPPRGPWYVVSNLPYSAGTPVVALLARLPNPPARQTLLLQAELAERMAAPPGTGSYGALSVRLQALYRVSTLRDVPPALFWPRPAVDSRLVGLELLGQRPDAEHLAALDRLAAALFGGRRKTLRRLLTDRFGAEGARAALAATGLGGELRPEQVPVPAFLELARRLPAG